MSDQPELLKVREVADLFRVHEATVYRLVEKGRLSVVRVGIGRKGIRITQDAVEQFLAESVA